MRSEETVCADGAPLSLPLVHLNSLCGALPQMKLLTSLRLQIMSLDPDILWWVPNVLIATADLPLAEITLEFTFDAGSLKKECPAWARIATELGTGWRKTLGRVTFVHHPPAGNFIADLTEENVEYTLRRRFEGLERRRILEVQIGTRYM